MAVLTIPKENVIRHKDIAPGRKNDIWNEFFKEWFENWQAKLFAKAWN
jgi:N-acetyl-anhydromuramyl-L-alanine amidase AmpD